MEHLQGIEINEGSREEILPGFMGDFPYIATCAELDKYREPLVPWHWHRAVELFYMESGTLEYTTPRGKWIFTAGTGGFVNSNVLHTTRVLPSDDSTVQLLHLFDPTFLSGERGNRIENKYILPLTASGVELIPLSPTDPAQSEILSQMKVAFSLSEEVWGYELALRESLSRSWLLLLAQASSAVQGGINKESDDKIKQLLIYIHEHFHESLTIEQLARHIHVSKRGCFRLFQETLHTTPAAYIRSVRLQEACRLLTDSNTPITQIAYSCGLGSSSYFGKCFRDAFGCTPAEYRKHWHDDDTNRHESYSFS